VQKLKIYQSLWGMQLRSPHAEERSDEQSFAMIADAGFDGVCLDPAVDEIPANLDKIDLFRQFDLGCMVNAFPMTENDMQPLLEFARKMRACTVNVISGVMPMRPEEAVPVVRRWIAEAAAQDMPLLFETHRDGMLNDLYFTLQLMEMVPEMRLCADLSHFVVDRELRVPITTRDQQFISAVLRRSDSFQGRVASREQIQVQIDFPQHQQWVKVFKAWWREGMQLWRQRSGPDDTLVFLCELGPPPYAITDASQGELSDRWRESLTIRDWVRAIWAELEAVDQAPGLPA
jgi:hypothetical protein